MMLMTIKTCKGWPWCRPRFFLFFLTLFFARNAIAGPIVTTSLWESLAIKGQVLSVAYGDANNDYNMDLVYVTKDRLVVQAPAQDGVLTIIKSGIKSEFHRVWLSDWDGDGLYEILVNGFFKGQVFSRLYQLSDKKFVLKADWDFLVVPLKTPDGNELHGQYYLGQGRWQDRAFRLVFAQGKWALDTKTFFLLNHGLSESPTSLYDVTGSSDGLVAMGADGKLSFIKSNGAKQNRSTLAYGGAVDFAQNESRGKILLNPRFAVQADKIIVARNDGFLGASVAIGAVPSIKSTQIVALGLSPVGLQEQASSVRLAGAITDVTCVDYDNDGVDELLVSLIVGKAGFFDAYGQGESVIIIMPIPTPG